MHLNSRGGGGAAVTGGALGFRQSLAVTVFPFNAGPGTQGYDFEPVTILAATQFPIADGTPTSQMALAAPSNNMNPSGAALGVFSLLFNGSTWDRPFYCPNTSTFSVANTTTQIVPASG